MFAGGAYHSLGVLVQSRSVMLLHCVLMLRLYKASGHLNSVKLIGADAATKYFLSACFGVEIPLASSLDNRDGLRPIVIAYGEEGSLRIL